MDRKSVIGLLLIAGVVILFSILNMPSQEEIDAQNRYNDSIVKVQDSIANQKKKVAIENAKSTDTTAQALTQQIIGNDSTKKELGAADSLKLDSLMTLQKSKELQDKYGMFSSSAEGKKEIVYIENDLLKVGVTTKGGGIATVELKQFKSYKDYSENRPAYLKLFDADSSKMNLEFAAQGRAYTTEDYYFTSSLKGKESVTMTLKSNDGKASIDITYSVKKGEYNVDYKIKSTGFENNIFNESAILAWNMKPLTTEKLITSERQVSSIFYKYVDEGRSYLSEFSNDELNLEAKTQWVALKTAYFSNIIIAPKGLKKDKSKIEVKNVVSDKYLKTYNAYLNVSADRGEKTIQDLKFYFGPNDFDILSAQGYEIDRVINLGWGIFGWVNKWLVIPVFNLLDAMHLNYGIIILLLTLIVKLIIMPLTYRNYKSSAKMRVLKPEIAEINKKFGSEDPMKKQQATMALYRQSGVSPLAGCIPVLIQMPVLIAVFRFFPSAIELRQQSFLWAEDLSAFDSIANLGFSIPAYGDHVSLFTILMCASTILFTYVNSGQMDTSAAMPGIKFMMYFFPVMMLFFFNNMSAGLSYYYFVSNILSILIMWAVKKYFIDENKIRMQIEEYKKRPQAQKKSKFQQRLEEAQRARAEQLKNKKK